METVERPAAEGIGGERPQAVRFRMEGAAAEKAADYLQGRIRAGILLLNRTKRARSLSLRSISPNIFMLAALFCPLLKEME